MPITTDLGEEKQRISDQLAKVDAEISRLQDHLSELEVAERVLSRFTQSKGEAKRRGRVAGPRSQTADDRATVHKSSRAKAGAAVERQAMPLGEAALRAVRAHRGGISAENVREYIAKEFGLEVRPNHLGMALQRHRRAGRLDIRDSRWHAL
jgi:hypothetical protein